MTIPAVALALVLSLNIINTAKADVCFLPEGGCEDVNTKNFWPCVGSDCPDPSRCDASYNSRQAYNGCGVACTKCADADSPYYGLYNCPENTCNCDEYTSTEAYNECGVACSVCRITSDKNYGKYKCPEVPIGGCNAQCSDFTLTEEDECKDCEQCTNENAPADKKGLWKCTECDQNVYNHTKASLTDKQKADHCDESDTCGCYIKCDSCFGYEYTLQDCQDAGYDSAKNECTGMRGKVYESCCNTCNGYIYSSDLSKTSEGWSCTECPNSCDGGSKFSCGCKEGYHADGGNCVLNQCTSGVAENTCDPATHTFTSNNTSFTNTSGNTIRCGTCVKNEPESEPEPVACQYQNPVMKPEYNIILGRIGYQIRNDSTGFRSVIFGTNELATTYGLTGECFFCGNSCGNSDNCMPRCYNGPEQYASGADNKLLGRNGIYYRLFFRSEEPFSPISLSSGNIDFGMSVSTSTAVHTGGGMEDCDVNVSFGAKNFTQAGTYTDFFSGWHPYCNDNSNWVEKFRPDFESMENLEGGGVDSSTRPVANQAEFNFVNASNSNWRLTLYYDESDPNTDWSYSISYDGGNTTYGGDITSEEYDDQDIAIPHWGDGVIIIPLDECGNELFTITLDSATFPMECAITGGYNLSDEVECNWGREERFRTPWCSRCECNEFYDDDGTAWNVYFSFRSEVENISGGNCYFGCDMEASVYMKVDFDDPGYPSGYNGSEYWNSKMNVSGHLTTRGPFQEGGEKTFNKDVGFCYGCDYDGKVASDSWLYGNNYYTYELNDIKIKITHPSRPGWSATVEYDRNSREWLYVEAGLEIISYNSMPNNIPQQDDYETWATEYVSGDGYKNFRPFIVKNGSYYDLYLQNYLCGRIIKLHFSDSEFPLN